MYNYSFLRRFTIKEQYANYTIILQYFAVYKNFKSQKYKSYTLICHTFVYIKANFYFKRLE